MKNTSQNIIVVLIANFIIENHLQSLSKINCGKTKCLIKLIKKTLVTK